MTLALQVMLWLPIVAVGVLVAVKSGGLILRLTWEWARTERPRPEQGNSARPGVRPATQIKT